ncbi:hypothetical protein, partial [Kocuria palustris]|uniref:hypothetical protein n=1 Tax=Kocuria palustris TaxID=71999 RepID=UPI001F2349B3
RSSQSSLRSPLESADPAIGLGFFRSGARPPTALIVEFIDQHKQKFGAHTDLPHAHVGGHAERTEHVLRLQDPPTLQAISSR